MAKEDFKKTRTNIDLVSMTNVGTSMAKVGGAKSGKKMTPKSSYAAKHKQRNVNEAIKQAKSDKVTSRPSKTPAKPKPKGKP